jgi:hypothetical protein
MIQNVCSTVQYTTVQYSAVQYSTVQYTTVQYSTVQYTRVQYSTVQYSTLQYSTVQYSTVQYSTVQLYRQFELYPIYLPHMYRLHKVESLTKPERGDNQSDRNTKPSAGSPSVARHTSAYLA